MADNVQITAGAGVTVAADEVADGVLGTVKVQYVKLMDGALDGTGKAGVGANGLAVEAASGVKLTSNTPTVSTSAYSSGMVLGAVQAFASQPASGLVASVQSFLKSGTFTGAIDLFLFSANPSAGTYADHAAFTLNATDGSSLMGVINIPTHTPAGGALAVGSLTGVGMPFVLGATTLYVVAVVRGALTLAAASDAVFTLGVVK